MSEYDLLSADDSPTRVDAATASTGLASGTLRAGRPLRLRHSSGEIMEIPPEQVGRALQSGRFVLDTPEDAERRAYARTQTHVDEGVTAAASLLREGSLGASELGEEALGIREDIDRMRDANPTAASIGDVAGLVLPALATGGVSAEARAAGEGASLASRALGAVTAPSRGALVAGERLGAATTRALAGEGASATRRVLARAAGGAVEGATQSAGMEAGGILTESALGDDPGDVAERLIAAGGLGAVLGGGLMGGGALLGEGLSTARRTGSEVASLARRQFESATGAELEPGIASIIGGLADASGAVSGRDAGAIRALSRLDDAGRRARRVIEGGDDVLQGHTTEMTAALDRVFRASEHVTGEMTGSLKTSAVERVIGGDVTRQTLAADSGIARVREMIAAIQEDSGRAGSRYGQGASAAAARLEQATRVAEDRMFAALRGDAMSVERRGAEMFSALDDLKRQVGRARRYTRERYGQEALDGLYHELRAPLEDAVTWGDGAAALQRESNAPWSRYLNWSRDFDSAFLRDGESIAGTIGDRLSAGDSAKIDGFVRSMGTAANGSREQVFRDALEGLGALNESAISHFDLSPAARAQSAELRSALESVRGLAESASTDARTLNQWRQIGGGSGNMGALQLGGLGALALGPAGGAVGLLASPTTLVRTLGAIERMTRRMDGEIATAARGFFSRGARGASRASSDASRAARRVAVGVEAYRDRVARMDESGDPSRRAHDMAGATSQIGHAAPTVHAAVQSRAAQADAYLRGRRPRSTLRGEMLGGDASRGRLPPRAEIDKFMRAARAVDDPGSVIEDLRHGTLTRDGVDALRVVYPALYQRMVAAVATELGRKGAEPSYQDRIQIGMLLGVPTDPSLTPEAIAMLQTPRQAMSDQLATTTKTPDIAGAYASDSDRVSARSMTT